VRAHVHLPVDVDESQRMRTTDLLTLLGLTTAFVGAVVAAHAGCAGEGCLSGTAGPCTVPSPCTKIQFACEPGESTAVTAHRIAETEEPPRGIDALAAAGDVVLRNSRLTAVFDALDHPHYLAPTGGTLLDLTSAKGDDDSLNDLFQGTGLLPGDAAFYTSLETLEGDGYRAIQVRGHLAGHPEQPIATRYELRACEPGLRVRTEIVNREADAAIWTATDAWYWGGRENLPFTPTKGSGFVHPTIELTKIADVFRRVPFMAAAGHSTPASAYSTVACNADMLEGFEGSVVSAVGTARRIVEPRDSVVFERMIFVASGSAVAPAIDLALEARRLLFAEKFARIHGKIAIAGGRRPLARETRAAVLISEADRADEPASDRTPWSEALPAEDGTFSARVPAGRSYAIEVNAFGRVAATKLVRADADDVDAGEIAISAAASVSISATLDGARSDALVFFDPADDTTYESVRAKLLGAFVECAPLLGPPFGGSPACNRVLVREPVTVEVPSGRYHLYATAGPFATIARRAIDVAPGSTATVALDLFRLPLLPANALSADLHVHGGASFDSSIPDGARVRAFLASGIDVIATTDHDVVSSYEAAMKELGASDRLILMTGVETTGHILFNFVPDTIYPKVIGHWNFWPVPYLKNAPRRGAPIDDLLEPGQLFRAVREAGLEESGVIQLNHPMSEPELGRDLGWGRTVSLDLTKPIPKSYDGSGPSLFLRRPPGTPFANGDYDTEEVMNGTDNDHFLPFRAMWFYLLDQGIVHAGTANSDSHGLTDNVLGTPRNLVFTSVPRSRFDAALFNADVKKGRMIGTNGPIIEISTLGRDGAVHRPSTEAFEPDPAAKLSIRVTAAPWVPIAEIRIIVDGTVAETITEGIASPTDPFGRETLVRFEGERALSALLPVGAADSWLIVEAGHPLLAAGDLDCNGVPDTGDNNRDGVIDWRDVDRNDDDIVDASDTEGRAQPDPCDKDQDLGPLPKLARPSDREAPLYHFMVVTPGGYPLAFTNPLLFDRAGDGFSGPGLPKR
jgi:hypothetical protein